MLKILRNRIFSGKRQPALLLKLILYMNLYYRHEFLAPFVDELYLWAKVKRCLVHAWLPASVHTGPHRAASWVGVAVKGEGRLLEFRFCGYNSTTFLLSELGFLTRETNNPRKTFLKKHWEPNWTAKVKGERRAKVHRVLCLCKFGFLHLHSYEQSIIRKLLLNSRQVLAPF